MILKVKQNLSLLVTVCFYSFILTGCASMVDGTTQRVSFDSEPKGATITIGYKKTKDGKTELSEPMVAGVTPLTVELRRAQSTMVVISKDGYETKEVELNREMNNWVWGDIALLSLLSTSIDTSTGAFNEYKPGEYMVTLPPKN